VNGTNLDDLKTILLSMVPHIPTLNEVLKKKKKEEGEKEKD
jgi:hypothetical protein